MGRSITSSKKPDNTNKRPEISELLDWNNRTEKGWLEQGFTLDQVPDTGGLVILSEEKRFLSEVDVRQGDIERTVWQFVRVKAPDYSDPKHARKEYIYYHESWEGKNFRGIRIAPVSCHLVGKYHETLTKPVIDDQTGEITEYEFDKFRDRFYIPWNKKTIDDIIAKSAKSDKTTIIYTMKFSSHDYPTGGAELRNNFTYEQFTEWKWDDCFRWLLRPKEDKLSTDKVKTANAMNPHIV